MTAVGGTIVAPSSPSLASSIATVLLQLLTRSNRTARVPCVTLTSASLDCLWLTSCLPMGASCCSVLRLLVSARVSRANLVHPAGIKHQTRLPSGFGGNLGGVNEIRRQSHRVAKKKKTHNQAPVSRDGEELQNIPTAFTYCFA